MTRLKAKLPELGEMTSRLDDVVLQSPADETELVWLETRSVRVDHRLDENPAAENRSRTIVVRVREGGREGSFRTDCPSPGALHHAVRMALAVSRSRERLASLAPLPGASEPVPAEMELCDPQLSRLEVGDAQRLLEGSCEQLSGTLAWVEGRIAVVNSRELRRSVALTGATLSVQHGRGRGNGWAAASSRKLADLNVGRLVERAVERSGRRGTGDESTTDERPVLLSPEASAQLIDHLNRVAFTSQSYREGSSFLRQHLGVQVFDRNLSLIDDATAPEGLPVPFDLEGRTKRPIPLIVDGVPKTPALDLDAAAELGMAPTCHCLAGDDAQATNLMLGAGDQTESELLESVEDGVWIPRFETLEPLASQRVQFSATISGARRVRAGKLAESLPRLRWEDSLLRALSSVQALGRERTALATGSPLLGAIVAPSLALGPCPIVPTS